MKRIAQFLVTLVLSLAVLTWLGLQMVHYTTQEWFTRDVTLRAQLAVRGARHALIHYLENADTQSLTRLLDDITHDERILGATVCSVEKGTIATTKDFFKQFSCEAFLPRLNNKDGKLGSVQELHELPNGAVYVSLLPIEDDTNSFGYVILLHDLSFAQRREDRTQWILFLTVMSLGLGASGLTILLARLAWRGWNDELKAALKGENSRQSRFGPILSDIRAMAERLVSEREFDYKDGIWNAERLRHTLQHYLQDDTVVVVANREPYIHEYDAQNQIKVLHPASGLVTALEPIMRACSGIWVAHGSGSADRNTVDSNEHVGVPPGEESYSLRRVWLTEEEESGYYYGFSNEGLWPLCHTADARPVFRTEDWQHYVAINKRFAEVACSETNTEDPIILVQDYHLSLVPSFIRQKLPKATIISFWHIPWPTAERFGICPWREEILNGLLGSSVIGFHTQAHCNNFIDSVERFLETRTDREQHAVIQQGRPTLIRPYPISIEWPVRWLENIPSVTECRREIITKLNIDSSAILGLGIDRLDYTKGVEERLLAIEALLQKKPGLVGKLVFVQLAAPSRVKIERYRELNLTVESVAQRINARYGNDTYKPVILLREHHEPPTVFRFYRACQFCYVSSLHDGMNLVAKEFVASREDEQGVLILSQFTGAARELSEALLVNPYDIDEAASAIWTAVNMSTQEQAARMKAMRALLAEFNIYRWAGRMLVDAARLRRRERLSGLLSSGNISFHQKAS